jgi:hypothetical protein
MNKQQGTLYFPGKMHTTINPERKKDYPISQLIEGKLRKARVMLKKLPIDKVFLAILPRPDIYDNLTSEAHRKQFILNLQRILGLQKESSLEMPLILPTELYSNESHLNEKGRTVFTSIFRKSLLNALCKSNIKASEECTNLL